MPSVCTAFRSVRFRSLFTSIASPAVTCPWVQVVPPDAWLQLTYSSFERQLDAASAEPLQALLHAAATLQLPAPKWSGRLMERLQVSNGGWAAGEGLRQNLSCLSFNMKGWCMYMARG